MGRIFLMKFDNIRNSHDSNRKTKVEEPYERTVCSKQNSLMFNARDNAIPRVGLFFSIISSGPMLRRGKM